MIKSNKQVRIFGGIIVACFIIYLIFVYATSATRIPDDSIAVQFYYLNPSTNKLEAEQRIIPDGENEAVIQSVLNQWLGIPKNKNLIATKPNNLSILDVVYISNTNCLEIEFSPEYYEMSPTGEVFFRTSFVWTMTDIHFISDVHIFVDGMELLASDGSPTGLLNRTNHVINPVISPEKVQTRMVKLYFSDDKTLGLVPEERIITVNPDLVLEKYLVEQLIAGPTQAGHYPTIPPETKIRAVETDGDTCYVNLSSDFISKLTGDTAAERLAIYSIVNTLTEMPDVKKVQFLIESVKVDDFRGNHDLGSIFEKDESLILKD